ncbi:MAG: PfkB family carbohydrate kinase [Rhodoferax sp.]
MHQEQASQPLPAALPIRVATAGEALIDLIGSAEGCFDPCLGGAVYNLTRALALQGVGTVYLNPLSADRFGRQLAQGLAQAGVCLAQPGAVHEPTSLAVVALGAGGVPDYAFYRDGVADRRVSARALQAGCEAHAGIEVVCTGALALAPQDAGAYLPWLLQQRSLGRLVVVDANLRPQVMRDGDAYRRNVFDALGIAHVVKVSDEDLAHLQVPGRNALEQARALQRQCGAQCVALTLGAQGAALLLANGTVLMGRETRALDVLDTVGAGDCFLAGLVAAWLRQGLPKDWGRDAQTGTPEQAQTLLRSAIASASINVTRPGCQPPTLQELAPWSSVECTVA